MKRNLRIALVAALLFTTSVLLSACSKKEDARDVSARTTVANLIPASTVGFLSWSTNSPGYQKFKASAWGTWQNSLVSEMKKHADVTGGAAELAEADKVMGFLEDLGLSSSDPTKPEVVQDGVFFLDDSSDGTIAAGAYLEGNDKEDFSPRLASLKDRLVKEGARVSDASEGGVNGIIITPAASTEEAKGAPSAFFVLAKGNRLAIATTKALAARPFGTAVEDGLAAIRGRPSYTRGTSQLGNSGDELSFAFLDGARLIALASKLPHVDAAEDLKLFPLEGIAFSKTMGESLVSNAVFTLAPKSPAQEKVLEALKSPSAQTVAAKFPSDAVFLLGVDGKVVISLIEQAMSEMSPAERAPVEPIIGQLRSLKGIGIGVRKSSGDSPFPDLLLIGQSDSPEAITASIKEGLGAALASQLGQRMPWQERTVEGLKVNFFNTPLGMGAYLGASGDTVVLTTSLSGMEQSLRALKGGSTLGDTISKSSKELMVTSSPLVSVYADMGNAADLIESVQGSLAMFTGGQSGVDQEQLAMLRKLGKVSAGISFKDNALSLRASVDNPIPQS